MLKVQNLSYFSKDYGISLNRLSFSMKKSELMLFTGKGGQGQIELLQLLAGEKQQNSGEIIFNDTDIGGFSSYEREDAGIALLLNNNNNIFSNEVKTGFTSLLGYGKKFIDREWNFLSLSDNDKNLAIVKKYMRFCREEFVFPSLILCYEPFCGVAHNHKAILIDFFRYIKGLGIATIVCLESADDLLPLADKIAIVGNGELLSISSSEDYLKHDLTNLLGGHDV